MQKIKYKINQKIGKCFYLKDIESNSKHRRALFKCECGNEFESLITHVKSTKTKSCGCKKLELFRKSKLTHGKTKHPLYRVWRAMKERTLLSTNKSYCNYGGRGIKICDEWKNDFKNFYDWGIENGYESGLTIDRIDVNGNYEPDNCRWVDNFIQARNTRKIRTTNSSGYRGVSRSGKKWISRICIYNKSIYLGIFEDKKDAAIAYDNYVIYNNLEHTRNFDVKM